MDDATRSLPPEALRRTCDPASFDFDTTAKLPPLSVVLGQPRAIAALEFGTSIDGHGFNLFALGAPGSGKTTLIREYLERWAAGKPVPPDLCYVNNFADARRPVCLQLQPGRAAKFERDTAALVGELQEAIPRAFEAEAYVNQRSQILHDLEEKRRVALEQVETRVTHFGFQLVKAPGGLVLTPSLNGKPITDAELEQLSPEQREKLVQVRERLERDVEEALRQARELERQARDALHALDAETATFATRHLVDDMRTRYADVPEVVEYLNALQADVVQHADDFRKRPESEAAPPVLAGLAGLGAESQFTRYRVNVLVDNGGLSGAPVVVETNPTYHNLVGRIEHQAMWGGVQTDFTLIKPGALHRANGGWLIIPAREVLLNAFAWEGLKRALKDGALRVEELGTQLSLFSTVTLEPQPEPLNVKVVLIGNPALYYLLYNYDEDFQKLFKVKADFATQMDRTAEAEQAYALFANTVVQRDGGLPFDRSGVARLVEYGARAAGEQGKLSTRFGEIADVVREAAHHAGQGGHAAVTADDVRAAETARRYRHSLPEERLHESYADGTLLLEATGSAVGRINGLAVLSTGDYAFGHPARITATVAPGNRGVVSIEREVDLSGPIHGKGVLILAGYLAKQYGGAEPVSLTAHLVFEQSYGLVEGDSASLAELYALLSALAGAPLRQDVAVTGSVNQHGQVQAVGGINEKIEGFFDICQARGLSGTQGVLIPAANVRHLMLRDDVVAAAGAGQFHVWPATVVADGLRLLAGVEPGLASAGGYPAGTFHRQVADRLAGFRQVLKAPPEAKDDGREPALITS